MNQPAEREQNSLPAASIVQEMLRAVKIQGNGATDSTSVVTAIEKLVGTVAKKEIRFYLFPVSAGKRLMICWTVYSFLVFANQPSHAPFQSEIVRDV